MEARLGEGVVVEDSGEIVQRIVGEPVEIEPPAVSFGRRSPEEVSEVTGHKVGCGCLNCDRAKGRDG